MHLKSRKSNLERADSGMIVIRQVDPKREEVLGLITQLDEYQASMYPPESNHLDPLDELSKTNVHFLAAYDGTKICGIGAVKILNDYGEIKRMYVPGEYRSRGVAKDILKTLENHLVEKSVFIARLETGIHQHAAINLYKKLGYSEISPFGEYTKDPLSVFLEKKIDPIQLQG